MDENDRLQNFRDVVQKSRHIIVVAGAGLSAASGMNERNRQTRDRDDAHIYSFQGIPTFRDGGGMWRSLDAMSLATPAAFASNPSLVWQFYHYRRAKFVAICHLTCTCLPYFRTQST
jgi:NAD-dependent deacetylase sirtuin 5